jgi:hypothetical protein
LDPAVSVLVADHRVKPGDDQEIKGTSWIPAFAGMTMKEAAICRIARPLLERGEYMPAERYAVKDFLHVLVIFYTRSMRIMRGVFAT